MARRTTRPNSRELKIIKTYLLNRDGCICKICGCETPAEELVVEHIDNNPLNWDDSNMRLADQKCNIKKNPPYKGKRDIDNVCVSVELDDNPKPQSAEMARNLKSEPLFRSWLEKEMTKKLRMDLDDVIDSGAEYAGVCVDTVRGRYLRRLKSRLGPYNLELELGKKILVWKDEFFPFKEEVKKWTKE